jgi:hypothetical protein
MKLTNEEKQANKIARQEARQEAKRLAKIEAERNQKPVKSLYLSIEWKKSRTWGANPHLEARAEHYDGTQSHFNCTASGCGYDKESQVIADAFNDLLKYKLYQLDATKEQPYGLRCGDYKGYSGGIGVDCYYKISEAIGGTFKRVASGKTYDAYTFTDNQ